MISLVFFDRPKCSKYEKNTLNLIKGDQLRLVSKSVSKWRRSRNTIGFSRYIPCLCYGITTVSVDTCAVIEDPTIYKEVKV